MARSPWQLHIIGPQAVGKMTVGQQVAALTGAKLFYNHQVIDLLTEFFPFGSPEFRRLNERFRAGIIEEAAATGTNLVITGAWGFDDPEIDMLLHGWPEHVRSRGGIAYYLELRAPLEVRLERNRHAHRQSLKKTDWATDEALTALHGQHRWYSDEDFPWPEQHLVVDNTAVPPEEVARRAVERFGLR